MFQVILDVGLVLLHHLWITLDYEEVYTKFSRRNIGTVMATQYGKRLVRTPKVDSCKLY